jgi:flavin-dependent dehydrogenase
MITALSAPADPGKGVVIYGATSSGVIAAVTAARHGKSVVLIEPSQHVGGMTASGLGCTDVGRDSTIGGITREFYAGIREWYQDASHWRVQTPQEFLTKNKGKRISGDAWFVFEPHAAEQIPSAWSRAGNFPAVSFSIAVMKAT